MKRIIFKLTQFFKHSERLHVRQQPFVEPVEVISLMDRFQELFNERNKLAGLVGVQARTGA